MMKSCEGSGQTSGMQECLMDEGMERRGERKATMELQG
jgi:hypothetical protein